MSEHDKIKELFSEKLSHAEVPVRPDLWNGIASQIGTATSTTAAVSSGVSLFTKVIIGVSAASLVGVGAYMLLDTESEAVDSTPVIKDTIAISQSEVSDENVGSSKFEVISEETHKQTEGNPDKVSGDGEPVNPSVDVDRKQSSSTDDAFVYVPKVRKEVTPITNKNEQVNASSIVENEAQPNNEDASTKTESQATTETIVYKAEVTQIPNIFTPNNDGVNDVFEIQYKGELVDFQFVVLNKSNQPVFRSSNPNFRWNGEGLDQNPVAAEMYYYILTARDSAGNPINLYGQLQLTR